jgi:hypothetical protein
MQRRERRKRSKAGEKGARAPPPPTTTSLYSRRFLLRNEHQPVNQTIGGRTFDMLVYSDRRWRRGASLERGEPIAVAPYRRALGGRQCDTSFEKAGLHSGLARLFALFGRQPSLLPADGTGTASSRARSRTAPKCSPKILYITRWLTNAHGARLALQPLPQPMPHVANPEQWAPQNAQHGAKPTLRPASSIEIAWSTSTYQLHPFL